MWLVHTYGKTTPDRPVKWHPSDALPDLARELSRLAPVVLLDVLVDHRPAMVTNRPAEFCPVTGIGLPALRVSDFAVCAFPSRQAWIMGSLISAKLESHLSIHKRSHRFV